MVHPLRPPFTRETAIQKVRMAEDAWNACDPERVSLAHAEDNQRRNRAEFPRGRAEIVAFLITVAERKYHWDRSKPRPSDHPGLSDLGL